MLFLTSNSKYKCSPSTLRRINITFINSRDPRQGPRSDPSLTLINKCRRDNVTHKQN